MKNTVTIDDVRHIAELSKLEFSDEECEQMRAHLQKQVKNFEVLDTVDVSDVPPTAHILAAVNVLREDVAGASYKNEELLANAPESADGAYLVPRIL